MNEEEILKVIALRGFYLSKERVLRLDVVAKEAGVDAIHFYQWLYIESPLEPWPWPQDFSDVKPLEEWAKEHGFRYSSEPNQVLNISIDCRYDLANERFFKSVLDKMFADQVRKELAENPKAYFTDRGEKDDPSNRKITFFRSITFVTP